MDLEEVRDARNVFREREENSDDPDEHLILLELLGNDYEPSEIFTAWLWKTADQILPIVDDSVDSIEEIFEDFSYVKEGEDNLIE